MSSESSVSSRAIRRPAPVETDGPGISWGWFVGLVLAVLYGSLIPFDIDLAFLHHSIDTRFRSLSALPANLEDLTVNLLLYIPVGLAFVVCGRPGLVERIVRFPFAVGIGLGVSVLVETMQLAVGPRVASSMDVLVNTIGTALGASLGVGLYDVAVKALKRLRLMWISHPFTTGTLILTIGLFLFNLAPFDFVTSTEALRASFLHAQLSLHDLKAATVAAYSSYNIVTVICGSFWFFILGYGSALAYGETGRTRGHAFFMAFRDAVVVIVLIEVMQVFTASHCFELADIVHRSIAALLGAWIALFIIEVTKRPTWRRGPGLAAPSPVLICLGAAQLVVILIGTIYGSASSATTSSPMRIWWIPFEALWRQHSGVAADSIIATLLAYSAIAGTLVMLFVRVGIARPVWITCAGVAGLAVMAEGLRAVMNSGQVDVTTPILATLGAAVTVRLYVTLRQVFRAAHGTSGY